MNLEWSKDVLTGDIKFHGSIPASALAELKLDNFEKQMLSMQPESAADFLLDAELVFRRYDQQLKTAV